MKMLAIAGTSVRRLIRDRTNIFFVFIMPMMLILVLGAVFGGEFVPRVGVVSKGSGELGRDMVRRIRAVDGIRVRPYGDEGELVTSVERGEIEAGVIVPAGYDADLRAGKAVKVEYVARPSASAQALSNTIGSAVTEQGALLRAAAFAHERGAGTFTEALSRAEDLQSDIEGLDVAQRSVGKPFVFSRLGQFDLGAYSQLLLFVFLTSMTGSAALIQSRQLGVSHRMLSTPTSVRSILAGEAAGRLSVALVQGLLIIVGTSVMFGVDWGDPLGVAATFLMFSLGAAGVGMLMGSLFKNDQQASGIGVMIGLGLAALGGCMMPLALMRVFSPTLYAVAHITPHAWGIEAFEQLIIYDGTILDILPQLGVLAAFAAVMFALGTWRLRVSLTAGRV